MGSDEQLDALMEAAMCTESQGDGFDLAAIADAAGRPIDELSGHGGETMQDLEFLMAGAAEESAKGDGDLPTKDEELDAMLEGDRADEADEREAEAKGDAEDDEGDQQPEAKGEEGDKPEAKGEGGDQQPEAKGEEGDKPEAKGEEEAAAGNLPDSCRFDYASQQPMHFGHHPGMSEVLKGDCADMERVLGIEAPTRGGPLKKLQRGAKGNTKAEKKKKKTKAAGELKGGASFGKGKKKTKGGKGDGEAGDDVEWWWQ
eukprot:740992-Pyramimonas_sp.AAC.2